MSELVFGILRCTVPGADKAVAIDTGVDIDKRRIRYTKRLLDHPMYGRCISVSSATRRDIQYFWALPHELGNGVYIVPRMLLPKVTEYVRKQQAAFYAAADAFVLDYPAVVEKAKEELRSLYDPQDFPPPDVVRRKFTLTWVVFNMQPADPTTEVILSGILRSATIALCAELLSILRKFAAFLRPNRRMPFRESSLRNIRAWLETFGARNVYGDQRLSGLVASLHTLIAPIDAKTLRDDGVLQEEVLSRISSAVIYANSALPKEEVTER